MKDKIIKDGARKTGVAFDMYGHDFKIKVLQTLSLFGGNKQVWHEKMLTQMMTVEDDIDVINCKIDLMNKYRELILLNNELSLDD